jgi:hypothetical protein
LLVLGLGLFKYSFDRFVAVVVNTIGNSDTEDPRGQTTANKYALLLCSKRHEAVGVLRVQTLGTFLGKNFEESIGSVLI